MSQKIECDYCGVLEVGLTHKDWRHFKMISNNGGGYAIDVCPACAWRLGDNPTTALKRGMAYAPDRDNPESKENTE